MARLSPDGRGNLQVFWPRERADSAGVTDTLGGVRITTRSRVRSGMSGTRRRGRARRGKADKQDLWSAGQKVQDYRGAGLGRVECGLFAAEAE